MNFDIFEKVSGMDRSLRNSTTRLFTATGMAIKIHGERDFVLRTGSTEFVRTLLVTDLSCMEGILGLDFLEETKAVFDIAACCLVMPTCKIPLLKYNSEELVSVCVREETVIPPYSEMIISRYLNSSQVNVCDLEGCRVIEPVKFEDDSGLVLARTVITLELCSEVPIRIMNMSCEPVVLKQDTKVASAQTGEVISATGHQVCASGKKKHQGKELITLPEHLECLVDGASKNLSRIERDNLIKLLSDFSDIFAVPGGPLGRASLITHKIDTGDARPIRLPPRRMAPAQRNIAHQEIDKMLEQGVIQESSSPWASPIVLVKKKDGTTRFCVDYRKLNEVTRKDAYPLPRFDETLDTLTGSQWFCTMDLALGYWQIGMDSSDKCKTAFATHRGLYEFNVMPFGLCNAPGTFSRLMELVLRGLQWDRCLVYLDDIIVFGRTFG